MVTNVNTFGPPVEPAGTELEPVAPPPPAPPLANAADAAAANALLVRNAWTAAISLIVLLALFTAVFVLAALLLRPPTPPDMGVNNEVGVDNTGVDAAAAGLPLACE